jgi:hypothetical protein
MFRRGKIAMAVLFSLIALVGCAPVHQTIRPGGRNLDSIKKLAIVIPLEGNFAVFYERAKASSTPFWIGGVVGLSIAASYNQSQDDTLAKSFTNYLDGFSCRSVFKDSLTKSLMGGGRFSEILVFDKEPEPVEISKYDGILTFRILNWGICIVERGDPDLLASFIQLEARMVHVPTSNLIWDDHDKVIGQNKRPLDSYQKEKESFRKDIQETVEDAGRYMANIVLSVIR